MPEPLFRRMCRYIYLELDVPDWLEWDSEKSRKHLEDPERLNIYPIVSFFVGTNGRDVFYFAYDEESPKQWAMDPRGWEQLSDIIYDNKGVIRRVEMGRAPTWDCAVKLADYYGKVIKFTLTDGVPPEYIKKLEEEKTDIS